uniref:Uncharacterized protein n=1 Tax=Meloidogyne enterolobii TaxID=390850 RepID=A0A6V7VI38_MELEN|nr:unnamed protein product [Meloidogyne enterolobii]
MFKSSLLFVSILFTILLFSNKFTEIFAAPKNPCVGKCNILGRGDHCCFISPWPHLDYETTCCKSYIACDSFNGGCKLERQGK